MIRPIRTVYNPRQRIISRLDPAGRMAKVINTIADSLRARGKQLIVRDFLRSPKEMAAFVEAMKRVPDEVIVYTKCVPNDWQYRYPPHPLLGKVAPHPQIMELDLYNETGGNIACRDAGPGLLSGPAATGPGPRLDRGDRTS